MIPKKNRLKEKELKKVLQKWKPFFSYDIVLNYLKNNQNINKFAIIIWSKSVTNNITRNYFRRKFYDLTKDNLIPKNQQNGCSFVFVVKKKTKLDKNNKKTIISFEKNLDFLMKKTFSDK